MSPIDVMGITESDESPQLTSKGVLIPVLGYVRAGVPIEAVEEILDYEEISQEQARTGEFFALKIKGDSKEPKISEGDVVIVRKQSTVENGELAVVLVNGDDATVKKFSPEKIPFVIEPFTLHCLRHTFCTMMYEAGVDILVAQKQMGHSDVKTTLAIYTHLEQEHKQNNISKLDEYISNF